MFLKIMPLLLLGTWVTAPVSAQDLEESPLFRALQDEMQRNMARLQMEDLERPYHLEYTARDTESASVSASLGALNQSRQARARRLTVDLRVGDYGFDNTNFRGGGYTSSRRLALDDDYDALRHSIWLATDSAYKRAVEVIARKRAAIKTLNITERPDDFTEVEPNEFLGEVETPVIDRSEWEEVVKRLSAIFKEFPGIQTSTVRWYAGYSHQHFINSEGSRHRWGRAVTSLVASAQTQAEDGMRLEDSVVFEVPLSAGLPPEEEMAGRIRTLAADLTARIQSPDPEDYTGPVLFENVAAAQFFSGLFVHNIADPRIPLYRSAGGARSHRKAPLARKLGLKVMAKMFSVYDDPSLKEWKGTHLMGYYPVDDEGMAPQRVDLVEKGKLKALLMSRVPTLKASGTNGHGRGTGSSVGWPGNLVVEAAEPQSDDDLRAAFLDLCREEGLEYGLLVRKLSSGTDRPRVAYRVYVEDGREEPARGLSFQAVTIQTLRDIVAAGETKHIYHSGGGSTANSIVAPAIIVEEMDLKKPPPQRPKKPYLKHPSFE